MEPINFITTLSPAQHRSIARWYRISIAACCGTIVVIAILQSMQLWQLYTAMPTADMRNDQEMHRQLLQQHEAAQGLEKGLLAKSAFLAQQKQSLKHVTAVCNALHQYIAAHATLHTCTMTDTTITVSYGCASPRAAQSILHALRATQLFATIKLTSLTQRDNQCMATVTGITEKK